VNRGDNCDSYCVKYWETIADNLKKSGWGWGWVSAVDSEGRTIFISDAHRGDGKRFVVRANEKLTAFLELERAVCIHVLTQQFSELKIADEKLTAFLELERMINAM